MSTLPIFIIYIAKSHKENHKKGKQKITCDGHRKVSEVQVRYNSVSLCVLPQKTYQAPIIEYSAVSWEGMRSGIIKPFSSLI